MKTQELERAMSNVDFTPQSDMFDDLEEEKQESLLPKPQTEADQRQPSSEEEFERSSDQDLDFS